MGGRPPHPMIFFEPLHQSRCQPHMGRPHLKMNPPSEKHLPSY